MVSNKTLLISLIVILIVINTLSIIVYFQSNSPSSETKAVTGKSIVSIPVNESDVKENAGIINSIKNSIKEIFRSESSSSSSSSGNSESEDSADDSPEEDDRPGNTDSVPIFIDPSSISVKNNQEFIVYAKVNAGFNIYAVQFDLFYDKNILDVKSVQEGAFLRNGASTFPIININNETGKISVAITRYGTQTGVSGEGIIAEITFKSKNSGTSSLEFKNSQISDPQLKKVNVITSNGKVDVTT